MLGGGRILILLLCSRFLMLCNSRGTAEQQSRAWHGMEDGGWEMV